ncbi:hypothetical protein E2562_016002 [Oryza meyeriana var. granulata]|uniref:N-acetyltransferase domain-containing protein n=1 Tax=Oryza meyeriana var. granulata TaxID=110450 RepID=A0A6G1EM30_9ORYZ|nr:hypothetical protein E2562_016002 [Oryza meyeriana var. granulata]
MQKERERKDRDLLEGILIPENLVLLNLIFEELGYPAARLRVRGGNGGAINTPATTTLSFNNNKKKKNKWAACCACAKVQAQLQQVSVSGSELAARGFAVRRTTSGLDVGALNEVVVWLEDSASAGRPVAFARAAGDGVFNAVVWDVVVEPSCQGLGLGRAVMERLVAELRGKGVSNIALYAGPRVDDSTASSASPWIPTPSAAWPCIQIKLNAS